MIKYSFYILIAILFASCQKKEKKGIIQEEITQKEIKAAKDLIQGSFDDLWAGLDSTKILDYHTEDFYILEHGEVWTNREIKDYMKSSLQYKGLPRRVNHMDYLYIEKYGDAINIAYNNKATFYNGDSLVAEGHWLESALAIPTEKGWRLRTMHSTRIEQKQ